MNETSKAQQNQYSLTLEQLLAWCICNGFIAFAAICGNVLILTAFICFKNLRRRPNIFVAGLALADALVGVVSVPFWIATLVSIWLETMLWTRSWLYKLFLTLDVFSGLSSILHLLLITLERLYAIAWPVRHRVSSRRTYIVSSVVAWFIAMATSSFFLLPYMNLTMKTRFFVLLLCYLVPLFSICVAYIAIWAIVKFKDHGTKKELKLASTVFLVVVLFVLAWTPFMTINVIAYVCRTCSISQNAVYFTKLLHYSNSAFNPLVYGFRIPEFKRAILVLFHRKTGGWRASSLRCRSSFELRNNITRRGSRPTAGENGPKNCNFNLRVSFDQGSCITHCPDVLV